MFAFVSSSTSLWSASLLSGASLLFFYFLGSMCFNSFNLCYVMKGLPPTIRVLGIPIISEYIFVVDNDLFFGTHAAKGILRSFLGGLFELLLSFSYLIGLVCRQYSINSLRGMELDGSMYYGYHYAHLLHGGSPEYQNSQNVAFISNNTNNTNNTNKADDTAHGVSTTHTQGTDNAKIVRKRSKLDKHRHGNG
ncbi:hypothetical protein Tco_0062150 [Tanacetum coccineum]